MAKRTRKKNENFFDQEIFGHEIQKRRRKAGYSNVTKFSEAIEEKTGGYISPATLANIEGSASRVSIEDLMAICWTLYEYKWNEEIAALINQAMFASFQYKIVKKKYEEWEEDQADLDKEMSFRGEAMDYVKGKYNASIAFCCSDATTGEFEIKPIYENKFKNCPKCGTSIRFPENYSSRFVKCPECGKSVELEESDFI